MGFNRNACSAREMMARSLAEEAVKLAGEGRRQEGEAVFRRAFWHVSRMKGPLGNLRNDVTERSRLALILADRAVSAGMGAGFAVRMWKLGCNSDVLDEDARGSTDIYYPIGIMEMAMGERKGAPGNGKPGAGNGMEEDAAPAVACEAEAEREGVAARILRMLRGIFR